MALYKEGEKSKALCPFCGGLRSTTFRRRNMKTRNGIEMGEMLVAVCDTCDRVVGIPHQSIP